MSGILIKNIGELLVTANSHSNPLSLLNIPSESSIKNAWLSIENNVISGFGRMEDFKMQTIHSGMYEIDGSNKIVLPGWCDSHTHLVFAETREAEFNDRLNGLSYEEIAKRGGGILNSVKKLESIDEGFLFESALQRLDEIRKTGTVAVEIKSGYGLSLKSEIKMLRVIRKLKEISPLTIKATFLGAHAIPAEFRKNSTAYIDHIINEVLPEVAGEGLVDFIDIFCETGFFSANDSARLLDAGWKYNLPPKVHVNQFSSIGGIPVAVSKKALTVDHLEVLEPADIQALQNSSTIASLLPGCSFFLNISYSPAKTLMDAGIPLALASDYNPGTAPSGNMPFIISLACIKMGMSPIQAIYAATWNGSFAMGLGDSNGNIAIGKKADILISKPMNSAAGIPYSFGSNPIQSVIINGKLT